jgi:FkbM family methyltransferase
MYLFPFEQIEKGAKVVLYGAGAVGTDFVAQIKLSGYCQLVCVLDRRVSRICISVPDEIPVFPPEHIEKLEGYDYIVLAVRLPELAEEMRTYLRERAVPEEKILFCGDRSTRLGASEKLVYSIDGSDYLLWWFFRYLGIEKPRYIDIGAHHPFRQSNTAIFYREGCRGINIEANPELIEAFFVHRPDDLTLNIGIGATEGVLPFHVFSNPGLSTFSSAQAANIRKRFSNLSETVINVPVLTINKVIAEYAGGEWPHFMNIDIEGLEYEVLTVTDFAGEGPYAICVEVTKLDIKALNELMQNKGYLTYCRPKGNIIYARTDMLERLYE